MAKKNTQTEETIPTSNLKSQNAIASLVHAQPIEHLIYTIRNTQIILDEDIAKHNAQYPVIEVKEFTKSHDRFLILDNQVYLIGASLKDLGKKWFAVSLMSETYPEMLLLRL